ncbi:hypothetical protein BDN72DRAFT_814182 [Pluteus cervinus]|uniref:Uncharacterized protein n=1 Tax=Pluteus cervinus TaxID=181527 RepID=A0ACD3B6Y3_9AGAR|nr:hypothetical protein BDN72DRAFT_814182 [Pluteus cervinus]
MTVLESSGEYDLGLLWTLIQELGSQLNSNRSQAVELFSRVEDAKGRAVDSQSGFVLRRNNLHLSNEVYEAELTRMNASMIEENQGLVHDNKQLNMLIKEYEQTLETLMSNFRNRAQDVQEKELSLIREYERKLLSREEAYAEQELTTNTATSESLARISQLLRQFLRSMGGEDPERSEQTGEEEDPEGVDREPWMSTSGAEHAMEREVELARLEKENEELRRLMGLEPLYPRGPTYSESRHPTFEPPPRLEQQRSASRVGSGGGSGGHGAVGPYGTYKRMRPPS